MNSRALSDLHISKGNFENHLSARRAAIHKIAAMQGPLNGNYIALERQLSKADGELEDRKNSVGGRPVHVYFENKLFFWVIALVVAFAEVLANKELFDMIFLGTALKSLFVALVLSVALVSIAHWSGFSWRQIKSESEQKWVFGSLFIGFLTLIMLVITILGLMIVRAYFVTANVSTGGLGDIFGNISEQVRQLGLWGLITQAFSSIEAIALGLFNLMCVVVAWIIGFLSHDSDINYDKCFITVKKLEKKLNAKKQIYESELEKIYGQYQKKIGLARQAFMTAKSHLGSQVDVELDDDNFAADRRVVELQALELNEKQASRSTSTDTSNVIRRKGGWQDWGQKK
jgi:hypothetical protein